MFAFDPDQLRQAVAAAAGRQEVRAAVAALYADVQSQIDQRRPVCVISGRCCHFDDFGHRLYVTTLELAAFIGQLDPLRRDAAQAAASAGLPQPGCPFQAAKLCGVHAIRPFGCRIFFCDSTAQEWQQQQYEVFLSRLKSLHAEFAVDYFYVEWRAALAALLQG